MKQTRGIRNNNPCNIRRSKTAWQGEVKKLNGNADTAYCQFASVVMGLRAAFRLLRTYRDQYRIWCIKDIIYRWAPPQDHNATEAYIAFVEKQAGINRNCALTFCDYKPVVKAMCRIESNYTPKDDELEEAYRMVWPY